MPKFDVYVTSVPDQKARLIVARHIASVNPSIPLQAALGIAEKPPLLLFRGIELREAEQHIIRLKKSGIGFKINESKAEFVETAENAQNEDMEPQDSVINPQNFVDGGVIAPVSQNASFVQEEEPIAIGESEHTGQQTAAVYPQNSVDIDKSDTVSRKIPDDIKRQIVNAHNLPAEAQESITDNQKPADIQKIDAGSQKAIQTQVSADDGISKKGDDTLEEYVKSISSRKQPALPEKKSDTDKKHDKFKSGGNQKPLKTSASKEKKEGRNRFQSGIRISSLGDAEQSERKNFKRQAFIVVGVLIIITTVFFFLPKEKVYAIKSSDNPAEMSAKQDKAKSSKRSKVKGKTTETENEAASTADSRGPDSDSQNRKPRQPVSNQQRQQANAYVDSARALGNNIEFSVAFYRAAISFNPQNLAAWQGLLQAYRDLEKEAEAIETEERMKKIFGDRVESINSIVNPFGELIDTYRDDGTYRVEYKSNKRSQKDIIRDVFLLTRAIRNICDCENISVYASTGAGKGLLSHSGINTSSHSLNAFSSQAQIIWLE
ncbi:MAG: hypothetical protein LBI42_03690 [Chitinispirillales bacterium]|jgi:hypothetical protein|nr:hypothetical protein [Chitinispirillales bacterium]